MSVRPSIRPIFALPHRSLANLPPPPYQFYVAAMSNHPTDLLKEAKRLQDSLGPSPSEDQKQEVFDAVLKADIRLREAEEKRQLEARKPPVEAGTKAEHKLLSSLADLSRKELALIKDPTKQATSPTKVFEQAQKLYQDFLKNQK